MAEKVNITLTDDLDGSPATERVLFALDGTSYELDLNAKNATAFRTAVSAYQGAARRVGRGKYTSRRSTRRPTGVDAAAVRDWAALNEVHLNPRGRIPTAVLEQFRAAGH